MPKKLSKRKVTKSKKILRKPIRKAKPKSLRKNPPLGFINTSDNKDAAIEISGLTFEPVIGGVILKFYLDRNEKSFDILLYNNAVDFITTKLYSNSFSRFYSSIYFGKQKLGFVNIGKKESYKNEIEDIVLQKLQGGYLIELETNYISPSEFMSKIRKLGFKDKTEPSRFDSSKYIIMLFDNGIFLLNQILQNRKVPITTRERITKSIPSYEIGKPRTTFAKSGSITDKY